jgi:EpsI family protein
MPPDVGGDWRRRAETQSSWQPKFYGATEEQLWSYTKDGQEIDVYAAFYPYQRQDFEIVGWRNRFDDGKVWKKLTTVDSTVIELAGKPQSVLRTHLRRVGKQRLVLFWYWIDGRFEADPRVAKLRQLKTQLLGSDQSAAVIAVAADYDDTPDEAMARLQSFVAGSPSFETVFAGLIPAAKIKVAKTPKPSCSGDEPCVD